MGENKNKGNLTEGPIVKKIVFFAIPLLLGSLVQQLYNTVDLIFVGNYIGKSASAAIGASSLLVTCLVGFFGGMSVGSGVVISQVFGSKDLQKLKRAVHTTVSLSFAGGIILMAVGYLIAPVFIRLINTPESIRDAAIGYLRIYFLSLIFVVSYNLCSGVVRALGNSKGPLYIQLIGGFTNVAMDYVFVRVFENGINGVAWATFISQGVAALLTILSLTRLDPDYSLRIKDLGFDKEILREIVRIGIPAGAQSLLITLSNVMAQYHINSLGEDAIAAFTAYFKVELIIYHPIVALGRATMTFAGQNMGAGKMDRVRKGTLYTAIISMALAAVTAMAALPLGGVLFRVFNKEASVIALGRQIIGVTFPFYFIYSILQIFGDSMRGVGKSKVPMFIVMINICIIRTALLFLIVPRVMDIRGVAVTYPITWALTSICMLIYYLNYHKKEGSSIYKKES